MALENHKGKARIQVSISRQLLEMLDTYCNAIGVSRSAFIQTTLGQTLYSINQLQSSMAPALVQELQKADSAEVSDEEKQGRERWGDDYGKRPEGL